MNSNEQDIADGLTALYLAKGQVDSINRHNREEFHREGALIQQEYGSIVDGFFESNNKIGKAKNHNSSNKKPKKRRRPKQDESTTREKSWIGGSIPISERKIPQYDAIADPHCAYTKFSDAFQSSPFTAMQRESKSVSSRYMPKSSDHPNYGTQNESLSRSLPRMPPSTQFSSQQQQQQFRRSLSEIDNKGRNDKSIDPIRIRPLRPIVQMTQEHRHYHQGETVIQSNGDIDVSEKLNEFRQEALEAIEARELLLRRLMSTDRNQVDVNGHASMVRLLRAAALRCTETIASWHRAFRRAMLQTSDAERKHGLKHHQNDDVDETHKEGGGLNNDSDPNQVLGESDQVFDKEGDDMAVLGPMAFEWRGINYLTKMANDSQAPIGRIQGLVDALPPNCDLYRNPFLLEHNLDDTAVLVVPPIVSESSKSGMSHGIELLRLRRASRLIMGEEALRGVAQGEEMLNQEVLNDPMPTRGFKNDKSVAKKKSSTKSVLTNKQHLTNSRYSTKNGKNNVKNAIKRDGHLEGNHQVTNRNKILSSPLKTPEPQRKKVERMTPNSNSTFPSPLAPPSSSKNHHLFGASVSTISHDNNDDDDDEEENLNVEEMEELLEESSDQFLSHPPPQQQQNQFKQLTNATDSTPPQQGPVRSQSELFARLSSGVPALHPTPPVIPLAELEALAKLTSPPIPVVVAFAAARVLLSQNVNVLPNLNGTNPSALRSILRRPKVLARQLQNFDLACPVRPVVVKVLRPIVMNPKLSVMDIQRDSPCAAALFAWVKKVVLQHLQRVGEKLPDPNKILLDRLHGGGGGGVGQASSLGGSEGTFKSFLSMNKGHSGNFLNDPYFQDSFADVEIDDDFFKHENDDGDGENGMISSTRRRNPGLNLSRNHILSEKGEEYEDSEMLNNVFGTGHHNLGVDYVGDVEDDDLVTQKLFQQNISNKNLTLKEKKIRNERLAKLNQEKSSNKLKNDNHSVVDLGLPMSVQSKQKAEMELTMLDGAASQMLQSLQNQIISLKNELAKRGMLEKESKFASPLIHQAWGVPVMAPSSSSSSSSNGNLLIQNDISPHAPPSKVFFRPGRVLLWSGEIMSPVGGKDTIIELKKKFSPPTDEPTPFILQEKDSLKKDEEEEKARASNNFANEANKLQAAKDAATYRASSKNKRNKNEKIRKFDVKIYAIPQKGNTSHVLVEAVDANSNAFLPYATLQIDSVLVDKLCHCSPNELAEMLPNDRTLKIGPLIAALTIEEVKIKKNFNQSSSSALVRARRFMAEQENEIIYYDKDFPDLLALPKDKAKMIQNELETKISQDKEKLLKNQARINLRKSDRQIEISERIANGEDYDDLLVDIENDNVIDDDDDETTDSDGELSDDPKSSLTQNKPHKIVASKKIKRNKEDKSEDRFEKSIEKEGNDAIEEEEEEDEVDLPKNELNFSIVLLVDTLCHRGNLTISQRAYEIRATRREGGRRGDKCEDGGGERATTSTTKSSQKKNDADESGISFILWPCVNGRGPMDRLQLFVSDDEIELLLLGQPALFYRMTRKWSALQAVTLWLIKRLRIQKKDKKLGIDCDVLWLLRSIQLPNRLEKGWCLNGLTTSTQQQQQQQHSLNKYDVLGSSGSENEPQQFVMRMRQKGRNLTLTAVAVPPAGTKEALKFEQISNEDEEEMEMRVAHSHHAPPLLQSSPCILTLVIDEVRAFVGIPHKLKMSDLPSHEDDDVFADLLDNDRTNVYEDYGGGSNSTGSSFDKLMARISLIPTPPSSSSSSDNQPSPSQSPAGSPMSQSSHSSSSSLLRPNPVSLLTANSGVGISLDRTLSVDIREVSGIPCSITTAVHGNEILFTAVRVGHLDRPQGISSPSNGKGDKKNKNQSLPIPASQLAKPLRKLLNMTDAAQLLKERIRLPSAQLEAMLHPCHRKELALIVVPQLKIVVKQRRKGEGLFRIKEPNTKVAFDTTNTSTDSFNHQQPMDEVGENETNTIPVAELETSLYQSLYMLTVCVDGENRRNRIGCIEVDDQATLAAVRKQITTELDIEDIPTSYRFRFNDAPCARNQESMRLACSCAPNLLLYSRDPARDAKYHRIETLHPQGDPNDLFYDDNGYNSTDKFHKSSPPSSAAAVMAYPMYDSEDEMNKTTGGEEEEGGAMVAKKKKSKRRRRKKSEEEKESNSDDDPPPGPAPPRKPPKESGMEKRARIRREKRKSKRDAKAMRLKRPPDAASGRLHDGPEPLVPDPVLFVPVPLPAVVTVVQGLPEIWANSLIDLNGLLTGDDILRIGSVDSADYPVKARSDDVVRRRKPKPPPWHLRPGAIEQLAKETTEGEEENINHGEGDDNDDDGGIDGDVEDAAAVHEAEEGNGTDGADTTGLNSAASSKPGTPGLDETPHQSAPNTAASVASSSSRKRINSAKSLNSEQSAVQKGLSNRQIQRRKALERARELAAAAAELEVGALTDYETKIQSSVSLLVAAGGSGEMTLMKELNLWDTKIQRHHSSTETLEVLNSAINLLALKEKKKEKKLLKAQRKLLNLSKSDQDDDDLEDEDKVIKERNDKSSDDDDDDVDEDDEDEEEISKIEKKEVDEEMIIEEMDKSDLVNSSSSVASQTFSVDNRVGGGGVEKKEKEQTPEEFLEECKVASQKEQAETEAWEKADEWCDLFRELTPKFGPRTSGISWYPKKEALDEILDIAETNSQINVKKIYHHDEGEQNDNDDDDDDDGTIGSVVSSSLSSLRNRKKNKNKNSSHQELIKKLKQKQMNQNKEDMVNIGLGSRPPAKFIPKGRYGQLAADIVPLINHSHHLVHSSALTVVRELSRALRQEFFSLCNGESLLITILHRTREKKLRPLINDVLDTFFATGAIPLSNIVETVIPNILDSSIEVNKPIVRFTVWKWLKRCIARTDPVPNLTHVMNGKVLKAPTSYDSGSHLLLRDTRTKMLLLQISSRGVTSDFQHSKEASDTMFALVDLVARGCLRAAAIPPNISHEHKRVVAFTAKQRKMLLAEAAAAEIVSDEVAAGRAATPVSVTMSVTSSTLNGSSTVNTGGVPNMAEDSLNNHHRHHQDDDEDDDDDDDDDEIKKARKVLEDLANEPAPAVPPDDSVGCLARREILTISLYLEKLGGTCDPSSRLAELITMSKQRLMENCASALGISLELELDDEDEDDGYYGGSRGNSRASSRGGSRPGSRKSKHRKRGAYGKKPPFSPEDPWSGGEVSPPWWLPSPNELAERRKQLEAAAAAALAAATKEPPLKIKERLDRQIKELREDLEAAMRAKNFMQCLSIQKGIDQLKFDRRNIPGLSEELVAITSLQSLFRGLAGRKKMKEMKFQASLPPSPWITAIDPDSGIEYYWDPYRDYSTWDLQETGIELRKEIEARDIANAFGFFYQKQQEEKEEKERIGAHSTAQFIGTQGLTKPDNLVLENKEEAESLLNKWNHMPKKPKELQLVYLDVPFDAIRKQKVICDLKKRAEEEAEEAARLEEEEEEFELKKKGGGGGGGSFSVGGEDSEGDEVGNKRKADMNEKKKKRKKAAMQELSASLIPGTAAYALAAIRASAGTVDLTFGTEHKGPTSGGNGNATMMSGMSMADNEEETLDELDEPPIGTDFDNQRLWRLIPKDQDARTTWRIHYDSGRVRFDYEYQASRKKVTTFRVPQRFADLEPLVIDDWKALLDSGKDFRTKPMHAQRLDQFLNVSPKKILSYAYHMVGHSWYPNGEGITESKWSKFVKEMKIFPDMHKPKRSAQVELGFKRYIHEQEENITEKKRQADKAAGIGGRCLNEEYFEKAIVEMVQLRHPKMVDDPSGALQHVLMESVIMMPEVNGKVWNEAKRLAMIEEGKRQSAATRIQALIRKVQRVDVYRTQLRCLVIIQAIMRRYRCIMRYATRRHYLLDDLFYRVRWINAIIIQMAFRRFVAIRSFKEVIRAKHAELVSQWKSRRKKQYQRREKKFNSIMYRRVRTVNGTLTMQIMTRSSKGTLGDDDFGVLLTVYTPSNQRYFRFEIPDAQFRDFIYQATGRVQFSGNELLEPKYLRIVCDRLMCRVIDNAPIIYMSKKSTAERGVQIAKKGVNIPGGGRLIVTCYWSNDEVVFQTYDTRDSRPMRTALTMVVLRNWLTDQLVWERKRAKRLVNAKRGEARKMLKCETLGIPVPDMHVAWARDFLSKTGGDRDCNIDVWTPDSKPWDVKEVPMDVMLSVDSAAAHTLGYQRRMEAEAEMEGWTEESVVQVAKATAATEKAKLHATNVKDGIIPYTEEEACVDLSHGSAFTPPSKVLQQKVLEAEAAITVLPNDQKSTSSTEDDEDDDEDDGEGNSKSSWAKEYAIRFPDMPIPPSTFFEDELLEMGEDPPLLRPNRRKDLVDWLLSKLHIARFKQGEKRGLPQLVLAYELDLDNQAEAAARIQGLQRMYKARRRVRHSTKLKYEKRYDRESGSMYYVFVPDEWTKHSSEATWQWKKPKCLEYRGISDDCAPPENVWRDMYVHITEEEAELLAEDPKTKKVKLLDVRGTSQEDGPPCTKMYYMNPGTGQVAQMNITEAAQIIQNLVRHFLSREIGRITIKLMIKALKIQFESEEKFLAFPNRLSSIVNWAMVLHTMHHDLDGAKTLYKKAMEISPENPVLLRASSLFTLMTCEPPRTSSWQRAMSNLRAAELRDPTREKFIVAEECLFHWAVVCNPKSPRCLLNFALLLQCVVKNYDLAEKFYRRAIAEDPDDKLVVRNYLDFEAQRLPGGLYAGGGPPLAALKTSTIEDEKFDWGEWKLMRNSNAHDQRFSLFWAAELLGKTSWEEPKWDEVWANIVARSTKTKDLGGWIEWYDPKLKVSFFQNPSMHPPKIQKQSPYHTGDLSKQDRKASSSSSSASSASVTTASIK